MAKGFFNNFNLLENELEMRKSLYIIIALSLFIACEDEKAAEDETPTIEYSNARRATWTDGSLKASYEWSADGKTVNVIDPDTKELLVRREYNDYGYRTLQVEKYSWGQTDSSVMTYDIWKPLSENRYSHNGSGDLLREEFITINEFGDWLTSVNKSNNVVLQSVTLTYKADRFKPYYTQ